ncbi:hypothetical protein [Priestia aryabhattai]|uniref:hypothetical protein n=1 Tax=Priestia aryabhattai TaxID=412384 RepID=UPI0006994385|nr:hypothetical protein [Priestia aryabhattai]
MLYYFTASSKEALDHYNKTIVHKVDVSRYMDQLQPSTIKDLNSNGCENTTHMWGVKSGKGNIGRWNRIKKGDKVLIYSRGIFKYYATIVAKEKNPTISKDIWGTDSDGKTWEYLFFIKDLTPIHITREQFNEFFMYSPNFIPQGFGNVAKNTINNMVKEYESIDNITKILNNIDLLKIKYSFNDNALKLYNTSVFLTDSANDSLPFKTIITNLVDQLLNAKQDLKAINNIISFVSNLLHESYLSKENKIAFWRTVYGQFIIKQLPLMAYSNEEISEAISTALEKIKEAEKKLHNTIDPSEE